MKLTLATQCGSWDFTTPTKATMKRLPGAKAIIIEHGGYC